MSLSFPPSVPLVCSRLTAHVSQFVTRLLQMNVVAYQDLHSKLRLATRAIDAAGTQANQTLQTLHQVGEVVQRVAAPIHALSDVLKRLSWTLCGGAGAFVVGLHVVALALYLVDRLKLRRGGVVARVTTCLVVGTGLTPASHPGLDLTD